MRVEVRVEVRVEGAVGSGGLVVVGMKDITTEAIGVFGFGELEAIGMKGTARGYR